MFIGRNFELNSLQKHYDMGTFQFAVIYGRRRIGKTALINQFLNDKKAIFFTAVEENADDNLRRLSEAIHFFQNPDLRDESTFNSFDQAFKQIVNLAQNQRVILVIDEYPYLAKAYPAVSSILQFYIDQYFQKTDLFLILCGSSMSFMEEQVLGYKSPLYGRRTVQYKLHPFSQKEAEEMLKGMDKESVFVLNSVTGGIPQYLQHMSPSLDVYENITENFLGTDTLLFEEPSNLLKQELREPANYNSIINAIAHGASRANDIAMKAHIPSASLTGYLNSLIELGIVEKQVPITEIENPKTRKVIYRLSDDTFRFWYTFVGPNVSAIEARHIRPVLTQIKQELPHFLGPSFEKLSQNYLWDHADDEDLIPEYFQHLGNWWGTQHGQAVEMDIVGYSRDKKTWFFGECKWKNSPVDQKVLETLIERSRNFPALKSYFYLFSKNGFTEGCKKLAKECNCHLITFSEM